MPYDKVFEPVVAGGTVFIGFNDSDKVIAVDQETGEEKWAYYCDGPVRLPPVVWKDRVLFVSDDGYLYCLQTSDGTLQWKRRGGPSDRKILGNSRLISTWPARGGPVVTDGIVYWGASIWPFMGIFIYAHDVESGDLVWMNDEESARFRQQPHGGAISFANIAPQGAFAVNGDALLVSGGRSVPAIFDRNTGAFEYYRVADYSKTGGSFIATIGDLFFSHHREKVTTAYGLEDGEELAGRVGKHPVLTLEIFYFSGEQVTAVDADAFRKDPRKWQNAVLWIAPVDARGDLIKAGNRLYAAGDGRITALECGPAKEQWSVAWVKAVEGHVERLVAANGVLIVVTLDGRVMAFGSSGETPVLRPPKPLVTSSPESTLDAADAILTDTGVNDGYALVYGPGNGALVEALAAKSNLHIVAISPDAANVERLRRHFDVTGLSGRRVAVLEGDPFSLDLPPYLASLTVVQELNPDRCPRDEKLLHTLFQSTRPYGGVVWLPKTPANAPLKPLCDASDLPGLTYREASAIMLSREGPLPGSAWWTHNLGDPAQTAKSNDTLVKLPLGLLWFGGSSNEDVLPRHGHGPSEQVIGGRLFIQGINCMSARDVYTGRVIWKRMLHDLGTYNVYYDETYKVTPTDTRYNQVHIPGANIRGTNFVATLDALYVIQGSETHVLDTATGATKNVFRLPPVDPDARKKHYPEWGYIAVTDDLLLGGAGFVAFSDAASLKSSQYSIWTDFDRSASQKLVALDRHTGEHVWTLPSRHGFLHNGIAIGNGTLFCLDKMPPGIENRLRRRGIKPEAYARLSAIDVRTADLEWQTDKDVFGSFLSYSEEHDILIQSTRPSRDTVVDEEGRRMIAYRGSTGDVLWDKEVSYATFPILHGERIITESTCLDLKTGERLTWAHPLSGDEMPWTWTRAYGCNYPLAAEHLLTFRSGAAGFYDLDNYGGTGNFGGFKSGCSNSLIVADGVLNAPDYTRTCSCSYQNQTSLALVHMPDVEMWTFNSVGTPDGTIQQIGINLGAPGDRRVSEGTLWLDYPDVGGPSPKVDIAAAPESIDWFRHHSSYIQSGSCPWIVASGAYGLRELKLRLQPDDAAEKRYRVRLFFAEEDDIESGPRLFDIAVQGKTVAENVDIAALSGGPRREHVLDFRDVGVTGHLVVSLTPRTDLKTLLCGVEAIAEDLQQRQKLAGAYE
ncbi:MAG: PQQ-binding-like beta-propeller repeat protein, partial [Candidatus Hydrogenedentes bacterium]|nr:PQQ-binding-like beta-propeller repeat protein [Candidatus Hydrogenedentota bacterium]